MTGLPCESLFSGLFTASNALVTRAADPEIAMWGATLAPSPGVPVPIVVGGAGETLEQARLASLGEGIERHRAHPLPSDERLLASVARWPLPERVVPLRAWALFHEDQYSAPGFAFSPVREETPYRFSRFRELSSGEPVWVPEDLAYLFPPVGETHRIAPGTSTGLVAGTLGQPLLLRGVQECIERDAVLGAWWRRYPIEEWPSSVVFAALGAELERRLTRPNLRYRFFRVRSPYSVHVALVTLEGQERAVNVFSAGAACRETLPEAFRKASIEAVQGRHFVRYLLDAGQCPAPSRFPTSFAEHAAYYTVNPERRKDTVLFDARPAQGALDDSVETLSVLRERLGSNRPVLFRIMTPPNVAQTMPEWTVLRVVIPGLQPIHGHHELAHLGGALWGAAPITDYARIPPHPMP